MNILPYIGDEDGSQAVPLASWLIGLFKSTDEDILMPPAPDMFIPGIAGAAGTGFLAAGPGILIPGIAIPGMAIPGMAWL